MDPLFGLGTPAGLGGPGEGWDVWPLWTFLFVAVVARRALGSRSGVKVLVIALAAALLTPAVIVLGGLPLLCGVLVGAWVTARKTIRPHPGDPSTSV